MYNLRARACAIPAGAVRPHLGIGAYAPPAVASQVTPTQALELMEEDSQCEMELMLDDTVVSGSEATQPPPQEKCKYPGSANPLAETVFGMHSERDKVANHALVIM